MTTATTTATRANAMPILIAASVMMSLAMGMRQCLGLFLPPMTQALAMSASDFTFAIAVQNIVWGLAQAPLGAVADRWGLRPVMVLGAMAYVAAMAIMTAATGVWMFVLAQTFVGIGIACTGSSLAMTATARAASPERRSVVLGIVGAFSSVGTLVIAPVLQGLLGVWDWRWGAVLFVILAAAMVPAAMITGRVDRLPQPSLQRVSAAAAIAGALRNRRFVVLCCTHFVCGLQLIFINTHLPNYLALCGQDPMLGATALAIIGGINIAGCLLAGYLGQRYLKNVLLGITYLARSAVLMIYFMFPPDPCHDDRLRGGDGNDVAGRHSAGVGLCRRPVRHAQHGDAAGCIVRHPPDGLGHRRLGRRHDLRHVRQLRPCLAVRRIPWHRRGHRPDPVWRSLRHAVRRAAGARNGLSARNAIGHFS
jgi:MFS family permease